MMWRSASEASPSLPSLDARGTEYRNGRTGSHSDWLRRRVRFSFFRTCKLLRREVNQTSPQRLMAPRL